VVASTPNGNVPPGTYSVVDGFVLAQVAVAPRLSWSLGGRVESSKLHSEPRPQDALTPFTVADLTLDRRWSAATWSTGAVYRVAGNWSVAGNVATGFRAPTFSDTLSTGVPVFASGVASIPSTGVDPEHSITYEIGPRYQSPRVNFTLTTYTNQLSDVLSSSPAGTIAIPGVGVVQALKNANIASAHVRGLESAVAFRVTSQLTALANVTVTRGQDTLANVPLRFIPPANGLVGVLWERPARGAWLEANARVADRLRRHAPQDELDAGFSTDPGFGSPSATNPALPGFQIPGWTMVTVRGGITVWQAAADRTRIEATLDVNNVFNAQYREAYSQQQLYAPSAGVVAGLRVRF
jgi:outer membrane receptor protein involved in Fe transport